MSQPLPITSAAPEPAFPPVQSWTPAERELWRILDQGLLGYGFRRHAVLNGVLVGFYCPELGLVLELVDNSSPVPQPPLEKALAGLHLKVVRLSAEQVNRPTLVAAIEAVLEPGRLWPED